MSIQAITDVLGLPILEGIIAALKGAPLTIP